MSIATCAFAQNPAQNPPYPGGTVKIISPFATGGIADTFARVIAQQLSEVFHQPFVVENKTGGGGNIGADLVAKAAPNGYTLVMGSIGTHAVNQYLVKDMPYDPIRDFSPVAYVMNAEGLLVINPSVPANNVGELIELIRSQPGKFSFGSGGNGTSGHLAGELFKAMAKVDMVHVPYKGNTLASNDLIGGQTQAMFPGLAAAMPHIRSGRARPLAVTGPMRHGLLKDIPTLEESGFKGFDAQQWYGVVGPAGLPADVLKTLSETLTLTLQAPDMAEKLAIEAIEPRPMSPEAFGKFIKADIARWTQLAKERNIQLEG
ncbi:MAG: tripartite tricarboxylate transporter substrate binding protein [Burkholderiales bacterium]